MKDARHLIVVHALKLFMERGYEGMILSELTSTSGFSKGAIYHHFRDKEDLFLATVDAFFLQYLPSSANNRDIAGVQAAVADLLDGYSAMLSAIDRITPDRLAYFRFLLSIAPRIRPQLSEHMNIARNRLIAAFSDEASEGRLLVDQDPAMLADQVLGLIEGCALLAAIEDRESPADVMRHTVHAFVNAILRQPL